MAADLERLVVSLSADIKQYDRALRKAMGQTNKTAGRIEKRFTRMNSAISAGAARLRGTLIGAFAGAVSVNALKNFSDAATRIDNALKVAGLSGEDLEKVYERLRNSAVKNAAPLEALVELYGRAALVQKELGISGEELLNFTDKIAVALRVSGKSAEESSGALLQLSQVLGSGVVRAEEFNSILEGALPIAQAAARGLKEAGGSVAKLRQLIVDGKVSSEAFFRAFEAGAPSIEEKVKNAEFTISQALGNLRTSLLDSVREFDRATGFGKQFADNINDVALAINNVDFKEFIDKISTAYGELDRFLTDLGNAGVIERFAEAVTGLELTAGQPIDLETVEAEKDLANLERQIGILKDRIEANKSMAIDTTEAEAQLDALIAKAAAARSVLTSGNVRGYEPGTPGDPNALARATPAPKTVTPVSLKDFDPPDKDKKKAKKRADDYERLAKRIADATAATVVETEAQRQLNPLIDDYGYAVERARIQQDLLNAAKEQGKTVTPELREQINQLAHQYATATVEAAKLAEEQDKIREKAEELAEFNKDLARGIIDGFIEGKNAAEIFADALKKVGDRLINDVLDGIFQIKNAAGGGGIFGFLGSIFGGGGFGMFPGGFGSGVGSNLLWADGGYTGPGGKNQPAGTVHKGEYVFSKKAVDKIGVGNLESMHRNLKGYAEGGFVAPSMPTLRPSTAGAGETYAPQYNIDARGAETGVEQKISQALRAYDKGNYQRWLSGAAQARKRNAG